MSATASWPQLTIGRRLRLSLIVWLAVLGIDFLLNGALFAGMYLQGGSFFLPPLEAFRRIPLGYLAFLVLALGIVEIACRFRSATLADGVRLGLALGGALAAVLSLSLFSVSTLRAETAAAFALIWLALVLTGSTVAAVGLGRSSLRGLALATIAADVVCVVIVIALQSFGVVPTLKA